MYVNYIVNHQNSRTRFIVEIKNQYFTIIYFRIAIIFNQNIRICQFIFLRQYFIFLGLSERYIERGMQS